MGNIFGTIAPPPGSNFVGNDPVAGTGTLIGTAIKLVFFIAGLAALVYLLWGAFDWIMSSGKKEDVEKAQQKIISAVIGLILIVVAFTVFSFIMGTVLGGKFGIGSNLKISIPHL